MSSSELIEILKTWCTFVVALVFGALFLLLTACFWIWRQTVGLLARILKRNVLGKMFVGLDTFFLLIDTNVYGAPDMNVITFLVIKGNLHLEILTKAFEEILTTKNENGQYDKLRQFPTSWCGYLFHRRESPFNISAHIKSIEGIVEGNLNAFASSRALLPYPKNTAMWEIILLPNFDVQGNMGVFFRFHHSLGDGISAICLLQQLANLSVVTTEPVVVDRQCPERRIGIERVSRLANRIYNDFVSIPRKFILEGRNLRTIDVVDNESPGTCFVGRTNAIDLAAFKRSKKKLNIPFTSVLNAVFAKTLCEGLRKKILKNVESELEYLTCISPMLLPGHPTHQFVNHFTMATMNLQMDENKDLKSRLEYSKETLANAIESVSPMISNYLLRLGNQFPTALSKYIIVPPPKRRNYGIITSNFIGPACPTYFLDHLILDMSFWTVGRICPWITFNVLSYNGILKIGCSGGSNVVQNEEAMIIICDRLQNEIQAIIDHADIN